jgi:sugar lactone lactonase YvrE
VTRDGRAVLTDSDAATVYLLRPGAERLEVLVPSTPDFSGPNGIALSRDERTAYVAHLEGISAVRLADGRRTRLRHARGIATSGIDGMYRCGDRLVAIQALVGHDRIAAFRLSASGDSIVSVTTLERSHPAFAAPATGTIVNDTLHYIARRRPSRVTGDTTSALVLRLPVGRCD